MAKISYLEKVIKRLKALKAGIVANLASWTGQADTPASVQAHIDALEQIDAEISSLENQLSQKRQAAKQLAAQKTAAADATEKRANGIHASATNKLPEYGIDDPAAVAAAKANRTIPGKGHIKSIIDDYDGIGFIVELSKIPDAEGYEVERGIGGNPADVNTIPDFKHLKTTTKLKFVDDEVDKGVRHFYRFRAFNNKGTGEWSEPVSRVQ